MSESEHETKARRKLSGVERVMSFVAPERAYQRMVARERIHEFAAVRQSSARGKLATAFDQGSSESWRKQRERLDAMWEGREMEENFCIIAGLLQKLGIYICGQHMGSWRYGATLTGDVGHQMQADLDPARLRLGPPED
jgi:hypothetical protein